mmetsp:Transcript_17622/g.25733  ORF Transcript_17622/g.25733 Transcript_17622/m.25733 type:complete len:203 (-) Transcript_17622:413-1021(-)|eukprot:CAMPEP_0113937694 /NCGR_PEP_ID=MMETSP1339-20121228/4259_1 /TAXON_ID=94617 /ORGANISM="Fibrocapsa japonica" /LENGTH=202 /DNA_ID=CAMNT_0000940557 /DNA_START=52 /DNA_END=660 /DNA_ORIENTATION=+ /assembly_acc=CAM_ASM_000762
MGQGNADEILNEFAVLVSHVKQQGWSSVKPWAEFFGRFSMPPKPNEGLGQRLRENYVRFAVNYAAIIAVTTILAILLSPGLLIVMLLITGMFAYTFLTRQKVLRLGSMEVGTNAKLAVSVLVSLLVLSLTGYVWKLFWVMGIGALVCVLHGCFRHSTGAKGGGATRGSRAESSSSVDVEGGVVSGGINEVNATRMRRTGNVQ